MIMQQEIPYARVMATIPREMRDRLPPELTGILEVNVRSPGRKSVSIAFLLTLTKKLPKAEHVHRGVQAIMIFYQRRFGLRLPALNTPMVLFRHIKRLALPSMSKNCLVLIRFFLSNKLQLRYMMQP